MSRPDSNPASTSGKDVIDAAIARLLERWVNWVIGRPRSIVAIISIVSIALLGYAALNLRINSDNVSLVSENLPARVNHEAFARLFPNLENGLFVVIDADTPELARDAVDQLSEVISNESELFSEVYIPGGGDFFEHNGLLYRSAEELDDFADQMAQMQPIIAALERDPSIGNMASLITQGLEATARDGSLAASWPSLLDRVSDATIAVYSEFPVAISWEQMLLQGSAIESVVRRVLIVHPILDFGDALAARTHVEFIRTTATDLGLTPDQGIRVRVTGNPALNYEELVGLFWDIGIGGLICFLVVIAILYRALRSINLVLTAVVTLLVGLVWTGAFAAFAIGHLNIVSLAFAVLFIGLGVDFGIHLGMRYGDILCRGASHQEALDGAIESVGASLLICSVTTAIGFFVFVPTEYRGVAELGLISGVGMFLIFFQTVTLYPALLTCAFRVDPERLRVRRFGFKGSWWLKLRPHSLAIAIGALILGLASFAAFPHLRFDPNVVNMRNPNTESVQAFNDLLNQAGVASPWFINSIAPDLESADARAARFRELDTVALTLTLSDYIPSDQDEKLEIIEDVAFLLDTPRGDPRAKSQSRVDLDDQIAALRALHDFLAGAPEAGRQGKTLHRSMQVLRDRLRVFLDRVDSDQDPEQALNDLETILLSNMPAQVARLRESLTATTITMDDLPDELVQRMRAPDGRIRIQVFPAVAMQDTASFERFVNGVLEIDPNGAGVSVNLIAFSHATRDSFQQALISAIAVIWLLLWLIWRRISPVLLATAPLALSSLLICAFMALADIPFQFANVVVIPLLLGIGIDSGIHLVHRAESLTSVKEDLMGTTTARAVFYSALTTAVSFGSLALSSHRGIASLGVLLSAGMIITVTCNLIVLPALIYLNRLRLARIAEHAASESSS